MKSRRLKIAAGIGASVVAAWLLFAGLAFRAMCNGPEAIGRFMAPIPGPLFAVMPFETLWNVARAGSLRVGDPAPDFELPTTDGSERIRLSSFRDQQPVVLVFGSYT